MKFIELFAGIGGFRLGLENTGHECVYTSEWLKNPASIYEYNFGDKPDGRDIRTINGAELPQADLIVGGFPCATFSVAGKRTGFCLSDTRGTLCFEMFRIAQERQIPYILFENVKGLLNHDKGRTFNVILSALDEMGYDCQWELLDSQNFGVPQHRERIFLIANLRGEPRPKVFPIGKTTPEDDKIRQRAQRKGERVWVKDTTRLIVGRKYQEKYRPVNKFNVVIGSLLHRMYSGNTNNFYIDDYSVSQYRRGGVFREFKSYGVPTLTANMGTGGHNVPFIIKNGKSNLRKLTPLECERLQGLPDNWTKFYADGSLTSNSERYERCGRTVTINVIEAIGRKLGYEWY